MKTIYEKKIKKLFIGICVALIFGANTAVLNAQEDDTSVGQLSASPESNFAYEALNDTYCRITDYFGDDDIVIIPPTLGGYTVQAIAYRAFEYGNFTEIDIPDSVAYIGPEAFLNCQRLEKVGYPAGWSQCFWGINNELYDGYAYNKTPFIGCSSLKEITVDEGVTSIPKYAFRGCNSLEKINLPESLTRIEGYAFDGCTSLKSITLPDAVTEIHHFAFAVCSNMDTAILSRGLKNMERAAFLGCTSLKEITIPEGVTIISETLFKDCISLDKVVLPDTVEVISSYAFENCTFTEIDIPDSVFYMGPHAFLNCRELEKIGYPAGWSQSFWFIHDEYYDGYSYNKTPFTGCTSLKEITVDEGVTSIPKYAFRGCDSLEKINLPESLTRINGYAFDCCPALKEITIPDSVTNIEHYSFAWCVNLEKVTLSRDIERIDGFVFNGCGNLTEIVIPCGKLDVLNDTGILKTENGFRVAETDNSNGVFTLIHSYQDGVCSCGAIQDLAILDVAGNTVRICSPTASAENDTVAVFIASYLGDRLVTSKFVNLPLKVGTNDYTVTDFDAGDCDRIRAFVWDSTESMIPLCKCSY